MFWRICGFFLGLGCIAAGVAATSKSMLGTTPIAAIPFSLSLIFPVLSLGVWVILFNLSLIVLEWLLLRGKIRFWTIVLQAFFACTFGSCVDLVSFALSGISPESYAARLGWVVGATGLLGIGAWLTIRTNIAVLPGDAFVLAMASLVKKDFGRVRLLSDLSMSVTALILCWIVFEDLVGVREGTLLASLMTGPIVRLLMRFG